MSKVGGYRGFSYFRDVCTRETNPGVKLGSVTDKYRCTATAKNSGARCTQFRVKGQKVCRFHGAQGVKPSRAKLRRIGARLRGERPSGYERD